MKRTILLPLLATLALAPSLARAETGQRLEITTEAKVQGPDAKAIVHALLGDAAAEKSHHSVAVKLINTGDFSTLQIEVHGVALPADSADRLRAMFPALRTAQIALVATDGTPLPPLPPNPADLSTPEEIAAFKQKIEAQLKAEGKTGTVEVSVETDAEGKKQVRVEVKAEGER